MKAQKYRFTLIDGTLAAVTVALVFQADLNLMDLVDCPHTAKAQCTKKMSPFRETPKPLIDPIEYVDASTATATATTSNSLQF